MFHDVDRSAGWAATLHNTCYQTTQKRLIANSWLSSNLSETEQQAQILRHIRKTTKIPNIKEKMYPPASLSLLADLSHVVPTQGVWMCKLSPGAAVVTATVLHNN